jgi:hypothetical protein
MSITRIPELGRQYFNSESNHETLPGILAVTPDDRLYSSLLYVSTHYGWKTRWTKSADCAAGILKSGTSAILLYDWYSASRSWRDATDRFLDLDSACCIVLAAPYIDEDLWEEARRHRVYDVVPRLGQSCVLAATLQFALRWKSKREFQRRANHGFAAVR